MTRTPRMVRPLLGALLLFAGIAGAADARTVPRAHLFEVQMAFQQVRVWSFVSTQAGEPCSRRTDGQGRDVVRLSNTALMTVRRGARAVAGFGMVGEHVRTGARTETVSGLDCPGTTIEPTTGCGTKRPTGLFPTLTLVGNRLRLRWQGVGVPESDACPFYSGDELPGPDYLNATTTINLQALLNPARRRITTAVRVTAGGTETCGAECPAGATHEASASVEAHLIIIFKRKRTP